MKYLLNLKMVLSLTNMLKSLFILVMLAGFGSSNAQQYQQISSHIDSLAAIGLPKSALKQVDKLDSLGQKNGNAPQQIRAAIYRMTFQSYLEENAIQEIIIRLKATIDKAAYPVKPVLQSLLAQMYWNYYQQNRYRFSQRSKPQKAGTDFTQWDLQTIINETGHQYDLSLTDVKKKQQTPVSILNGVLEGDTTTRYLRPTLYDLLVHRAFDFFLKDEAGINKPRLPFSINDPRFFGDSRMFAGLQIKTTDTLSAAYKGIKYLQQATLFHLQDKTRDALADVDLKRLEFVHSHSTIAEKNDLYLATIQKIGEDFAESPISSDAWVLAGKYYLNKDSLTTALTFFNKAVSKHPGSLGAKNASGYIRQIHQTDLSAITEDLNLPGKPLLALLNYRNVKTAKITLYKVWATQYNEMAAMHDDRYGFSNTYIQPIAPVMNYLKKLTPIKVERINLPGTDDYRNHSAEFKIDPLETGIYILIVQDPLSDDPETLQFSSFKVTRLSFVTRNTAERTTKICVMDRETGAPLPGVEVTADETDKKISDADGSCLFDIHLRNDNAYNRNNNYGVKLTLGADTLYNARRYRNGGFPSNNDNISYQRTILFTDRQIYRPGQTVYFKGICINTQSGKNSLLINENQLVTVRDNNGKVLTTIAVASNEFGSFSGTFVIPQNILNGTIAIGTLHGVKNVSVEEYKRPSFMVSMLPVKGNYKPNDSVSIKGTVMAYSGYGLSQAKVAYHITRQLQLMNYRRYDYRSNRYSFNLAEISTDTIKTNDKGEFTITFKATTDEASDNNLRYVFNISTDVTDGSGETQTAASSLTVAVKNLVIAASVPMQASANEPVKISAAINNLNGISQSGELKLRVYSLIQPAHFYKNRLWGQPDQYLLSKDEYKKDFPEYAYGNEDNRDTWAIKQQLVAISLKTDGNSRVNFNADLLKQPTGIYRVIINGKNTKGDTVSQTWYLNLLNKPAQPQTINDWVKYVNTDTRKNGPAEFWIGTGAPSHVLMEKFNGLTMVTSQWLTLSGKNQQLITVPVNAGENKLSVQFLTEYRNRLYVKRQLIENNYTNALDIKFLTFRNKLQPGEKEQWKLQISGGNDKKEAAEMVADLYDSSLDAIATPDRWGNILYNNNRYLPFYFNWSNESTAQSPTHSLNYKNFLFDPLQRNYEQLDINMGRFSANQVFASVSIRGLAVADPGYKSIKGVSNADVTIDEPVGSGSLNEVMVTGYTTQMRMDAVEYKAAPYQTINDYGNQANISGRPIVARKNFAETAFFYPQLHTNENGSILIDFTIPEELTTWRFKAFVHTKDLRTGYVEREIITQKELSITANAPRFLREGDTITISARLSNLTSSALKGKVELHLFNALNLQPVNLLANVADAQQPFELDAATNKPVSFKLIIPAGLDALTYRLTASSDKYSDGEENTLPVLLNRMLVTESMPMMVRAGQTKAFTFDKLVNQSSATLQSKTLTLEYTQNPAWYAVQALPYLMEFPYECSEQVFSRYYANSLAANLVNKLPQIKQVFDQWQKTNSPELLSNLEKNQELKQTLIEETPWLRDAENESERKKRISLLFDLNKMSYELQTNLTKLQQRQLPDGGFPWFGGDRSDRYITQHILAGMGQLYQLGIADLKDVALKDIADKAMSYLDDQLAAGDDHGKVNPIEIHAYYTQSYFTARVLTAQMQQLLANYLSLAEKQWVQRSVYEQAMIALTMQRNKKPEVADQIIKSLLETAQQSDDLGMYWGKNKLGYFWYESPVETQSLLIELFTEVGGHDKEVNEMKIWLLRNKQTSDWKTTKATAAACYALLLKGSNLLSSDGGTTIKLNAQPLEELKPDIKADVGSGYIKTTWVDDQIKTGLGKVEIANHGQTISWGALHWQYLENLDKITSAQTNIQLQRKYFIQKQTDGGPVLTAVDQNHLPKTGDLLKVVIYLKADRDFEYVQLKDLRPAGTEPADALSAYKYQDGLYYYQVTKDVATNFFISYLNKGNYVFEYQLRVAQPGNFSTGTTSIQSMYAPEFNAHSQGGRLTITP